MINNGGGSRQPSAYFQLLWRWGLLANRVGFGSFNDAVSKFTD
jgi:hypothetical protein